MARGPWGPKHQARQHRILKRLVEREGPGAGQCLLPLRAGEEVTLSRSLDVRLLRGRAELWGSVLRPSAAFLPVVAPTWAAVPRLTALRGKGAEGKELTDEDPDVQEFLASHSWSTVLCLRPAGGAGAATLRESLEVREEQSRLTAHRAWPIIVDKFSAMAGDLASSAPPVLLVMGNKGVGKSSCCRYFVNALLNGVREVCYLETDLGQPELGPPGLVSLHRVRKPLLKAAHVEQHAHDCTAKFFAGGATPATEPALYVKCVRAAFQAYLDLRKDDAPLPPLVVNTHGWSLGFGLELVRTVVGIVSPQLILRIGAEDEGERQVRRRGPKAITPPMPPPAKRRRTRLARCGPLAVTLAEAAGGGLEGKPPAALVDLPSQASKKRGPVAAELRWYRFAFYFQPDLDPCRRVHGTHPRELFNRRPRGRLPLGRLRFGLVHMDLPASEVEAAFTGTVVALCRLGWGEKGEAEAERPAEGPGRLPRLVRPRLGEDRAAGAPRCVALAYVHSFDWARDEVTFFSPAQEADLSEVDAVLRGDIKWYPHSARSVELPPGPLGMPPVSPLTPYCSMWALDGFSSGTTAAKSKHVTHRKLLRLRSALRRRAPAGTDGEE